jgi:starvation-inducible outer membrane lipoprotein
MSVVNVSYQYKDANVNVTTLWRLAQVLAWSEHFEVWSGGHFQAWGQNLIKLSMGRGA